MRARESSSELVEMSPRPSHLFLHEEIMLLALRDEEGTVEFGSNYVCAMCGAILAELLLAGRISVEDGKKKLVNLVSDEPIGDPVIDECLDKIASAKRRASLQTWLHRFWHVKKLHHRVAGGLCDRGILRANEDKVLLIFRRKIYPEIMANGWARRLPTPCRPPRLRSRSPASSPP